MRKIVFLLIASFALVFTACNKEKIDKVNPDELIVNRDKAELQKRITMLNYPITLNNFKTEPTTTSPELWAVAQIASGTATITEYVWSYTYPNTMLYSDGSVNPLQGTTITQTNQDPTAPIAPETNAPYILLSSSVIGTFPLSVTGAGADATTGTAYFTSHIRGGEYGGEIFVVDYDYNDLNVTEIAALGTVFDNSADYNDMTIDAAGGKLWIAGDNRQRGAILRNVTLASLNSGLTSTADVALTKFHTPLIGPSGNSVNIFGNQVWFVAGGQSYGGLLVMDKVAGTLYTRTDKTNAKHFDMCEISNGSGYTGAFLWGNGNFTDDKANLRIFNTSGGPFNYTDYLANTFYDASDAAHTLGDVTEYGKNAIDVDDDNNLPGGQQHIYLAMGADGVKKVDASTGLVVATFNSLPPTYGGELGLANALVVYKNYVYVAWGAHGLVVLNKTTMLPVGQWNGMGSANYVAIDTSDANPNTGVIWLGNGTGGMVLLKFVDDVNLPTGGI